MAMTLRLPEADDLALDAYAKKRGMSKQQTVLYLIRTGIERDSRVTEIDSIMDDVLEQDAELLDRLAQ